MGCSFNVHGPILIKDSVGPSSARALATEHSIRLVLGTFVGAILSGALSTRHASVLLPYFSRYDNFVDECDRKLVEKLKDDGLFDSAGTSTLVAVLTNALKDAFTDYLEDLRSNESTLLELAKLCASATTVYKGIVVVKKLPSEYFVNLHCDVITHVLEKISFLGPGAHPEKKGKAGSMFKALALMLRKLTPEEARLMYACDNYVAQVLLTNLRVTANPIYMKPCRRFNLKSMRTAGNLNEPMTDG